MAGGYYTPNASDILTAANWRQYVRDQSIPQFTSTGTRDAAITSPVQGMVCYVKAGDGTEGLYTYNGVAWRPGPGWNAPWGLVASASSTSDQTAISAEADITFATATWTAVTNRLYRITLTVLPSQVSSTGNQVLLIKTGSSGAGTLLGDVQTPSVTAGNSGAANVVTFQTGTGSISVHARASCTAGTITVANSSAKGWFIVEDVGPNGAPA